MSFKKLVHSFKLKIYRQRVACNTPLFFFFFMNLISESSQTLFSCSSAVNRILWPSLEGLLTSGVRRPGGAGRQLSSPQPGRHVTGAQGRLNVLPHRTIISSRPSPGQSHRTQACRVLSTPSVLSGLLCTWEQGAPSCSAH